MIMIAIIVCTIILSNVNSQIWTLTLTNSHFNLWNCIAVSGSGKYLLAGVYGGGLFTSNNSANSWYYYDDNATNQASWYSVAISDTGRYQLGGSGHGLFLSSSYGSNGSFSVPSSLSNISTLWSSVTMTATGQIMAAVLCCGNGGVDGGIYFSNNYGLVWSQSSSASSLDNWISITSNFIGNYMYAIKRHMNFTASVYTSSNNGMSWTISTAPNSKAFSQVVTCSSGQYVAIASLNDSIFISNNYGKSWTAAEGTSNVFWNDIVLDSTGQYYVAVGENSTIFSSYNYGNSFVNNDPTTKIGDATSISSNRSFGVIFIASSNSGENNTAGMDNYYHYECLINIYFKAYMNHQIG